MLDKQQFKKIENGIKDLEVNNLHPALNNKQERKQKFLTDTCLEAIYDN